MALAVGAAKAQSKWCTYQKDYCRGEEHIACEPNSFVDGKDVTNIRVVEMTDDLKNKILQRHNMYRTKIAKGEEANMPKSSNMRKMTWNAELADAANFQNKHCNFAHDKCRAIPACPYSGQNLAMSMSSAPFSDTTATTLKLIDSWYTEEMKIVRDEKRYCIGEFKADCLSAGHFTVMVNAENAFAGCVVRTYNQLKDGTLWNILSITCNYCGTNMLGSPVYKEGAPCTMCPSGTTGDTATGLCV